MKIKQCLAIFLAAACIGSVAGCSGQTPGPSAPGGGQADGNAASGEKVKIVFTLTDNLATTTNLMIKQFGEGMKRYNQENTTNTVAEVMEIAGTEYYNKINAMAAANQLPDLIHTSGGGRMKNYVNAGNYMDLTSYLNADQTWKDSFIPGIFSLVEFNGGVYGIPLNQSASCVFYNTEIFSANGIEIPSTWSEFLDVCEKLKNAGIIPIAMSGKDSWAIALFSAYLSNRIGGNTPFDAIVNGGGNWSDPCFIQSGLMTKELFDKGYVQSSSLGDGAGQAEAYVKSGQAAMIIMGSWVIGQLNAEDSQVAGKMGVFTFPGVDGGAGDPNMWLGKTDNFAVSTTSANPDNAVDFIKFLTSEKFQKDTAEIAGNVPVTRVDIDLTKAPKEFGFLSSELKKSTGLFNFYDESLGPQIGDEYNNTMQAIVAGAMTPEDAFAALQAYTVDLRATK